MKKAIALAALLALGALGMAVGPENNSSNQQTPPNTDDRAAATTGAYTAPDATTAVDPTLRM